ncbi:MAG: hypothetical protein LKI93_00875 [Bifidobacteriaceae bacterium]|jgi:D-ribose pyranose/furanose isomerase RbsD|nr:hypothetical protein [Bifidobacteriaceae bacterium]MCI1914487.1 hypothetical protein [Bifidobacteriaceae bacterium]
MKADTILNPELARGLATLGHGDIVLVTDAGFPIPKDATVVNLGLVQGTVDVLTILKVLRKNLFVEEVRFAPEVKTEYPALYEEFQDIYTGSGADFIKAPHEELIETWAPKAKLVIRSGSFTAWANLALTAATDPFAWYRDDEPVNPLPRYVERRERIREGAIPDFED